MVQASLPQPYHPCWWDMCGSDAGISVSAGPQSLASVASVSNGAFRAARAEGLGAAFSPVLPLRSAGPLQPSPAWSHWARLPSGVPAWPPWPKGCPGAVRGHRVRGAGRLTGWLLLPPAHCGGRRSCPVCGAAACLAPGSAAPGRLELPEGSVSLYADARENRWGFWQSRLC